MNSSDSIARSTRVVLILAGLVIIIAGMREAQAILVPFLLAGFIAIITAPLMFSLTALRIPSGIALLLVLALLLLLGVVLGGVVGRSVDDFLTQLPLYQAQLQQQWEAFAVWLDGWGVAFPDYTLAALFDPAKVMGLVAVGLASLGGLLANTLLILLTASFMLAEAARLPAKLHATFSDPERSLTHLYQVVADVKRYMAIKTLTSLLTGLLVALWLWIIGLDYPLLWGMLAFFLNFVPNIGSVLAAIPALLLALIQLGLGGMAWVAVGYAAINGILGNIIEPRFMGRGLGLSALVVFLSLVFWGWVLGAVGMLLSVPLTMTVKIILGSREETRWIAILLGPEIEAKEPPGGPRRPDPWSRLAEWLRQRLPKRR